MIDGFGFQVKLLEISKKKFTLTLSLLSASFLREKKEPFLVENLSNLTLEFLYDNFKKKVLLNFVVKIIIKNLMHFQGEIVHFFPQKQSAEKRKC